MRLDLLTPKQRLAASLAEKLRRKRLRRIYDMYPEAGPLRRELYPKHMEFMRLGAEHRERLFCAANRAGKALKHGTKVATPSGWVPIEALRVGDSVIAGNGSVTQVVGVFPQGVKPMLRFTFDAGEQIECCPDHLWLYQHPRSRYPYRQSHGGKEVNPFFGKWHVENAATIRAQVGDAPITRMRVVVPTCDPWDLAARELPMDPYLLGLLLGDGGLSRDSVKFTNVDPELIAAMRSGFEVSNYEGIDYGVKGATPIIRALGLLGKNSYNKFIPESYLLAGATQRLELLRGLMDTDGSIGINGAMEFSSVSEQLADGVMFLIASLGGKCTKECRQTHYTYKGERKAGAPCFRIRIRLNLCPFRLPRKVARWNPRHNTANRVLHRIEDAAPAECTCIEVAHPSHTYVIDHGIVTHNTEGAGGYELTWHLLGEYPDWWQGRRFDRPISSWAAGDTGKTTRNILQRKLMGPPGAIGTGLIPGARIKRATPKAGIADGIELVYVESAQGGLSLLEFKSYDQRREGFQGTEQDVILLDEEPPEDVYDECLLRTVETPGRPGGGIIMLTYTPIKGLTPLTLRFLPEYAPAEDESREGEE